MCGKTRPVNVRQFWLKQWFRTFETFRANRDDLPVREFKLLLF